MNATHLLLVGAGGFAGSVARYLTIVSIERKLNFAFPFGTLTVNLTGSFMLGILFGWFASRAGAGNEPWKLLLGTGFCGGFTTFSAFALENVNLLSQKLPLIALLYITLSIAGALLAVWIGFAISKTIF